MNRLLRLDLPLPYDAPHPVLGCTCLEGRLIEMLPPASERVVAWLPPVHDCAYIEEKGG